MTFAAAVREADVTEQKATNVRDFSTPAQSVDQDFIARFKLLRTIQIHLMAFV